MLMCVTNNDSMLFENQHHDVVLNLIMKIYIIVVKLNIINI